MAKKACSYHFNRIAVCSRERIVISDPLEVFLCAECLQNFKLSILSYDYKTYPLDEINIDIRNNTREDRLAK